MNAREETEKRRRRMKDSYSSLWRTEMLKLEEQFNAATTRIEQFKINAQIASLQGKYRYLNGGKEFDLDLHWIPKEEET